mmetsp:Transcript_3764/g.6581  ORF Transcript_3764/g.6581 Transcript_3764/m.6581 type:complete len:87 (-) Transcript_3764:989-1249(-)
MLDSVRSHRLFKWQVFLRTCIFRFYRFAETEPDNNSASVSLIERVFEMASMDLFALLIDRIFWYRRQHENLRRSTAVCDADGISSV